MRSTLGDGRNSLIARRNDSASRFSASSGRAGAASEAVVSETSTRPARRGPCGSGEAESGSFTAWGPTYSAIRLGGTMEAQADREADPSKRPTGFPTRPNRRMYHLIYSHIVL